MLVNKVKILWRQRWKSATQLELQVDLADEWNKYTQDLKHGAIMLNQEKDELTWSRNKDMGVYTAKLEYAAKKDDEEVRDNKWWWKKVWKLNSPLKTRIFFWLAMSNKILTWDNGQKRN